MSLDMDFFDWPQLAEHFGEDNLPAGLENISVPETNDVASLTWTDYFTPPNQSLNQTPALTQRSGSSFSSTQDSCQCQEGGEGSQNDVAEEEDETVGSTRSTGRPRAPLHSGMTPSEDKRAFVYGTLETTHTEQEFPAYLSSAENGGAAKIRREGYCCRGSFKATQSASFGVALGHCVFEVPGAAT
ncbi:hypothetical protein DL95DRAFT_413137 [Leptodontidium sp. 2 PMI_412]|nr:hypothetical protein DL95DRAFT_413137 [Leptodontidium sp. 2 PMI_412]